MSANILDFYHIDAILTWLKTRQQGKSFSIYYENETHIFDVQNPIHLTHIGTILMEQNIMSVNYRYRESRAPEPYVFTPFHRVLSEIEVLKGLDYYDYQSCETRNYQHTAAAQIVKGIRHRAIRALHGYDSAAWRIEQETTQKPKLISSR